MGKRIRGRTLFGFTLAALSATASGENETIAISGTAAPSGDGSYVSFELPRLTDWGHVGFVSALGDTANTSGVFVHRLPNMDFYGLDVFGPANLTEELRTNEASPDFDGNFDQFSALALTDDFYSNPRLAVRTTFSGSASTVGIVSKSSFSTPFVNAREGQVDDRGSNTYVGFGDPVLGKSGNPSFLATSTDTISTFQSINYNAYEGFRSFFDYSAFEADIVSLGRPTKAGPQGDSGYDPEIAFRAEVSNPLPDGGETEVIAIWDAFDYDLKIADSNAGTPAKSFGDPVMNDSGDLAYKSTDTTLGTVNAIHFRDRYGSPVTVVSTGDVSPDANGSFDDFTDPALSSTWIALHAGLTGTANGALDDQGIFTSNAGNPLNSIVRTNDVVPGEGVTFEDLQAPLVNGLGLVAFGAAIGNGIGGQVEALFLNGNGDTAIIARQGDALDGSFIANIDYLDLPDAGGQQAFNDYGQVAYRVDLLDGRQAIQLYTPELEFKGTGNASWIDPANWSFGMFPGKPHTAYYRPDSGNLVVDIPMELGVGNNFSRKVVVAPTGGATATLNVLDSGLFPSQFSTQTAYSEELVIGTNGTINVGSAPGGTEIRWEIDRLVMQGGVIGLTTPDAEGFISARSIVGFGTANDISRDCCGFAGSEFAADGGVLNISFTGYSDFFTHSLRTLPGATLNVQADIVSFWDTTVEVADSTSMVIDSVGSFVDPLNPFINERDLDVNSSTVSIGMNGNLDLTVGSGRKIDFDNSTVDLASGATLNMVTDPGVASEFEQTVVTLSGGTINAAGGIAANEGTHVTGFGDVNARFTGSPSAIIEADGGTLSIGDDTQFNGFSTVGKVIVRNGATLNLRSKINAASLGNQITIEGGTLSAANGIFLAGGRVLHGHGAVDAAVQAGIGSSIVAEGDLALGDSSRLDGFFGDGALHTGDNTVTINDANEAVLGALTTIGDANGAGTLDAANGIIVEFGKAVSGFGDIFGDLLNNGFIEGVGLLPGDGLDLHGLVKGVGGFGGTIFFSGTFSPGLSPGEVQFENVLTTSETVIELAGLAQGSDYDYINASGSATVGGTLEIDLLDGYTPVAGDEFVFLTAADGVFGTFDQVLFPQISGLAFALEYAADSVTLNVATAVPLPTGAWLLLSALPLLAARARCV